MQFRSVTPFNWLSSLSSTKKVLYVVVLSFQIFRLCLSAETAVIGVLTEMTNPMECEEIIPTVVYEMTSLQWLTKVFNQNNYTLDIQLEIDVQDICPYKSPVIRTIELINKYKSGPKKLFGILTRSTSAKMLNVSWFLSSLPAKDQIIQIGTTETVSKLNNRSLYPTFFRVIPDDEYQIQLIAKLLQLLKWNYIAILHEKDVYGEDASNLLKQQLPALGIILAAKLAIDNVNDINEKLFILTSDYSKVQGVVIIAQAWTLKRLTQVIEKEIGRYRFILTETVSTADHFSNLEVFKNSIAILRPQISFKSVERNWQNQFNPEHVKQNANFRKMIQQYAGCADALHSSCNLTKAVGKVSKVINKNTVLTKFFGLYTFAFLLREQRKQCGGLTCQLSALKMNDIQNKNIDFSHLSNILSYSSVNVTGKFNRKGNLDFPEGFKSYLVYSSLENKTTGQFSFKEVGQYTGKELKLNTCISKKIDMWGVCPKNKSCRACSEGFPKFLYRKGDIMLFGIVPVRISNDARKCPCLDKLTPLDLSGSQLAEAMLYAVETLNEGKIYKNLFRGKKIGIVIMDSCNQQIPAFETLLSFWRGTADICQNTLNCFDITNRTLVYIGAFSSEVSLRISQLMSAAQTVQISYASSSSIFSNPLSYEYPTFLRLVPSNSLQITAMIDICVKMKWLYVSLIYSDDVYGRLAEKELLVKARDSKICVTQSLPFKKGDSPFYFLERMKRRPEAKVVIILIHSEILESFMASLVENMEEREFVFLGSESLGQRLVNQRIGEKIIGSLTLSIHIPPNSAFEDYIQRKELDISKSNVWSLAAMESQCYKDLSLNKLSSKSCPRNFTLSKLIRQNPWSPMVIQSVYAAAVGLNMSINKFCKTVAVCPKLFRKISDVIEIFKGVKLKTTDGQYEQVFDKNGDGRGSYIIYQVQEKDKTYVYTNIGNWSPTRGLILETNQIDVPPLNCPNYKRCSECPVVKSNEAPMKAYISTLIAFVCLSVLAVVLIVLFCIYTRTGPTNQDNSENNNGPLNIQDEAESHENAYISIIEITGSSNEQTNSKQPFSDSDTITIPKTLFTSLLAINQSYEGTGPTNQDNNENNNGRLNIPNEAASHENDYISISEFTVSNNEQTNPKQVFSNDDNATIPKEFFSSSLTINPAYEEWRPNQMNKYLNDFGKNDNVLTNISTDSNVSDDRYSSGFIENRSVKRRNHSGMHEASQNGYDSDTSVKKTWDMSPGIENTAYKQNEL